MSMVRPGQWTRHEESTPWTSVPHLKLDASKVYKRVSAVTLWRQEKRRRQESIELDHPHLDDRAGKGVDQTDLCGLAMDASGGFTAEMGKSVAGL